MAISHTIPAKDAHRIVAQAQHELDVTRDYDLIVKVRDGVVHTYVSQTSKEAKPCIECTRYSELLARRERESYPNVAEE